MVYSYVKRIVSLCSEPTVFSHIIIIAIITIVVFVLAKNLPITEGKTH